MDTGEEICEWLLKAPDARAEEAMVRFLSDGALRSVSGFLGLHYEENSATGRLLGVCMVVSHERFLAAGTAQEVQAPVPVSAANQERTEILG